MTTLERLTAKMPEGVDALLITSDINRFYVSKMRSSDGTALIFRDAAYFIIDFRYIEKAKETVKGYTEVMLQQDRNRQVIDLMKKHNAKTIAIEEKVVTVSDAAALTEAFKPLEVLTNAGLSGILAELRSFKTPEEIACLHTAQEYTDAGFAYICKYIRRGMTERQIALELEFYMRKLGSEGMAFDTICVSGPNSSMPHGVPGNREVQDGDFLTMDFGGVAGGYCADMTRTIGIGTLSKDQLHVYDTVYAAQTAALKAARAGMTGKELDAIARDLINNAGYEGAFGHTLGHSLGLSVHEAPGASMWNQNPLPEGVMMTIEPGIYLEGKYGVRIENMILLQKDGCEDFTKSPRELILL